MTCGAREIGEMSSPERPSGASGRAGGGLAVNHGHAGGGRAAWHRLCGPQWSLPRAQPCACHVSKKSRFGEILSPVCGTRVTQIGSCYVLTTPPMV